MTPVRRAGVAAAFALAALCSFTGLAKADSSAPYTHLPAVGDKIQVDGTLGGSKSAWAYFDRLWLEEYLKITIEAANANKPYQDVADQLDRVSEHVTTVPNGTTASVEEIRPFAYQGRLDVEVRVLVTDGSRRGRELWTTCAELVDPAGHTYLRL